ncbi:MAG: CDP-alcohol phosphatidyltransferase family protein [Anaerolineae bacterium]
MLSERAREMTRGLLTDIAGVVARTGLTPSVLTWLGFVFSAFTAWVLSHGAFRAGGALVLIAGLFDALDGSLARATNRVSAFGAFLDSTLDRLAEAVLYLGLLVFFAGQPGSQQEIALTYLAIVGSLMVSYTRARAEGLGYECKVGLFTRFERVLVLSLGLLFGQMRVALWILAAGSFLTAFHRMWHVWKTVSE